MNPQDGTKAVFEATVYDADKPISDPVVYEFIFEAAPTVTPRPGTIGGGGLVLNENRDRVVEALNQMQEDDYSPINDGSAYLSDTIEIVLSNDGMELDNITDPQASKAEQGDEVLATCLGTQDDGVTPYYDARLKPVYKDVSKYVVAGNATLKNATIETATKKDYVLYYRAMVKVIDRAAADAVSVYNNPAYVTADDKYDAFIATAAADVISVIDAEFAGVADTTLKNDIKTLAVAYCMELFTTAKDPANKDTIKSELSALTAPLTIDQFAAILTDYLLMS